MPTNVRVLFRVDKSGTHKGTVTAVFDDTNESPLLACYEHVGQHGTASLDWLRTTRPARTDEYAPLLAELRSIGYAVTVGRRLVNYWHR